ncbi:4486_t:CDS:2 [Funneliformis mosseae]|uniref:4486_t:CDS:1 n=1 Tax=Funneliformis mosseae TaxID=27381 RepID=A0A9N9GY15_FUNMO|nr:4486_t:CDS:2 [Funneliformis mosseae]
MIRSSVTPFTVTASRKKLKSPSIDYWEREPGAWGSVSDWDIYYINNVPGVSKAQAHSSLGLELDIILKALPPKSRAYYKAEDLNKSLKFEILTTGIRAATGAVRAEFPPLKRKLNKPHSPDINDGDEKLTKKIRAEDEDQETIDYGRIYRILIIYSGDVGENLCKISTVETSSAITDFDLNKFRKEFIEDLSGILGDELQNIKRDMEKIKCQKKW